MAERLLRELDGLFCKNRQAGNAACTVTLVSATHHQTEPETSLWALQWKVTFSVKEKSESAWRETLAKKQFQLLDVFPDYLTGITYFRRHAGQFEQLSTAAFSELALNTRSKAVAHIAPELFRAGDIHYTLPANWQSDGLKAGDRGVISLTLPPTRTEFLTLRCTDLNDAPVKGIRIESCEMRGAGKDTTCNPDYIRLSHITNSISLTVAAEKKLKTFQPAFKILLQETGNAKTLLSLAIPYRPRPNYLVFGLAGFLFGGLIAVMVLLMRKRSVNISRVVSPNQQ